MATLTFNTKHWTLVFGLFAYGVFLATFLYAIGFTGTVVVPKDIDDGPITPVVNAVLVNLALLTLFACQHSVMARPAFKRWWTKIIPQPIERSVFVLSASLALLLLFWQWRPIPTIVWAASTPGLEAALHVLFWTGWGIVLASTFMISHLELFGVRQVVAHWTRRALPSTPFRTPYLYRYVRHPIYLGFVIAFWATPTMTAGHLLFAAVTTIYIFVGIHLEERDLIGMFGTAYRTYREQVGMLFPRVRLLGQQIPMEQPRAR
jgi:protein-S-isoprenylcysteine O-methyltransferase Ste14